MSVLEGRSYAGQTGAGKLSIEVTAQDEATIRLLNLVLLQNSRNFPEILQESVQSPRACAERLKMT